MFVGGSEGSMTEELVEEWRKFSLTKDEAPRFIVEGDAMGKAKEMGSHCLLGKLIIDKYFNRAVFKTTMLRLWGFAWGMTIQTMGDNLFLFQFSDEFERERVMQGSPWLFDNYQLALNAFDGSCPVHQIRFTHSCFWVQLHGVPMYYMTKETGERVGNVMGTVLEVAVPKSGIGWGPSLRVRLRLDITKPLPRGWLITFHYVGQMWVSFRYERLPWFCFHCGVLVHAEKVCAARLRASSLGGEQPEQYGPWLRAADSFQQRHKNGRDRWGGPVSGWPAQVAIPAGKSPMVNLHARFTSGGLDFSPPLSNLTNARDSVALVPKYP